MKGSFSIKTFTLIVAALFLTSLFSFSVYAGVPPPILTTTPEQSTWIADGVTQYKITIEADSLASPDSFAGVNVKYFLPTAQGYTFNVVSFNLLPLNDFFAGATTMHFSNSATYTYGRLVTSGTYPFRTSGAVMEVFFTVSANSPNALPVETSLGFDGDQTYFLLSDLETEVFPEPQSVAFTVQAPVLSCPADLDDGTGSGNPDNGVDVNDLLFFLREFEAGSVNADLDDGTGSGNPDNGVDVNDLLFFLSHFEQGC